METDYLNFTANLADCLDARYRGNRDEAQEAAVDVAASARSLTGDEREFAEAFLDVHGLEIAIAPVTFVEA